LKAVREKTQITYKGKPIKFTAHFSMETFHPRILYPVKLSFKIDGAIKIFHKKQKLRQHMTMKPSLQKILQGILHTENESKQNHERTDSIKSQKKKRQGITE
jgi:hypothetical protein